MGTAFTANDVLRFLDHCLRENPCWSFIDLEHPYVHTANSRLTLYADDDRWAIVSEVSGYSDRADRFSLTLNFFGNCLRDLEPAGNMNQFTWNIHFVTLLDQAPLQDFINQFGNPAQPMLSVALRDQVVQVPGSMQGLRRLIPDIESRSFPVGVRRQDLGRYVAYQYADPCRATDAEKRIHLPADLPELMTVDRWHHRTYHYYHGAELPGPRGDAPSSYETFRLLADVLVTRDPTRYRSKLPPNNHWSNWPAAGTL